MVAYQDDQFVAPVADFSSESFLSRAMKTNLIVFPDFPYEVGERLIHIYALLSRGLDEFASEVLGKVAALCPGGQRYAEYRGFSYVPFIPT